MAAIGEYHEDAQPRAGNQPDEPMGESPECGICSDVLKDGCPVHGLPCAHVFHLECLDAYGQARGMHFEKLPCPTCKKIPLDLAKQGIRQRAEMRMQARAQMALEGPFAAGVMMPVPDGQFPFDDEPVEPVHMEAEWPVADVPMVPEADRAMVPEADPPVDAAAPVEPAADPPVEPLLAIDADSDDEALRNLQLPPAGEGAAHAELPAPADVPRAKGKAKAKAKAKGKANVAADAEMQGSDMEDPPQAPAGVPRAKSKAKAKAKAKGKAQADVAADADMEDPHQAPPAEPVAKAKAKAKAAKAKAKAKAADAVEAIQPLPDLEPVDLEPLPDCFFCAQQCENRKLVKSLSRKEFMCRKCNNKRIQLYKAGEFPDTSALSNDEAKAFWNQMKQIQDKGVSIQMSRAASLNKFNREETENNEGSEFLPASVWAAKGFDADRIVRLSKPENIKEDEVLGTCYRLEISSSYNKRTHGQAFEDKAHADPRGQASGSGQANNNSDLSIKERMELQVKRLAELRQQAKQTMNDRKKLLDPARKEFTWLTKMEGELKLAKLPEHMQGNNPLEKVKAKLTQIMNDIEFHNEDEVNQSSDTKEALDKAVKESALTRKMMRPFC